MKHRSYFVAALVGSAAMSLSANTQAELTYNLPNRALQASQAHQAAKKGGVRSNISTRAEPYELRTTTKRSN